VGLGSEARAPEGPYQSRFSPVINTLRELSATWASLLSKAVILGLAAMMLSRP